MDRLKGKTAIVTGAASGIGRGIDERARISLPAGDEIGVVAVRTQHQFFDLKR